MHPQHCNRQSFEEAEVQGRRAVRECIRKRQSGLTPGFSGAADGGRDVVWPSGRPRTQVVCGAGPVRFTGVSRGLAAESKGRRHVQNRCRGRGLCPQDGSGLGGQVHPSDGVSRQTRPDGSLTERLTTWVSRPSGARWWSEGPPQATGWVTGLQCRRLAHHTRRGQPE